LKYRRKSDGKVVWACVKTSLGCSKCYAETIALRWDRGRLFNAKNMEELEPFLDEQELREMLTRKTCGGVNVEGSRCFLADMTDVFGEWVPDGLLDRLFSTVLEVRTGVVWQILTKRAERMQHYLSWRWGEGRLPSRHIWLGVSVEDQQRADERIPHLLQTPAAVRFLSCEPLLGPVDLTRWLVKGWCPACKLPCFVHERLGGCCGCGCPDARRHLSWVIAGGESGSHFRPCDPAWVADIARQCDDAGVRVFVKQGSGPRPGLQGDIPDSIWSLKEFPTP